MIFLNKNKIVKSIDNVPIYKNKNSKKLYADFPSWLRGYMKVEPCLVEAADFKDLYIDFLKWCNENELKAE